MDVPVKDWLLLRARLRMLASLVQLPRGVRTLPVLAGWPSMAHAEDDLGPYPEGAFCAIVERYADVH